MAPTSEGRVHRDQDLEAALERLQFYRAEIRHEFDLLANRVSSFIASQSFLVLGFTLSVSNAAPGWGVRLAFPLAIAILGAILSALVMPGILGASETIDLWRAKQAALFDEAAEELEPFRLRRRVSGRGIDLVHRRSLRFAKLAPWIFLCAWLGFGALASLLIVQLG